MRRHLNPTLIVLLLSVILASKSIAEESPSQRLFAECFVTKQAAVDRYIAGLRELMVKQGQNQQLQEAAATYKKISRMVFAKSLPKPTPDSSDEANQLLQTLHDDLNAANGVLRRAFQELIAVESKAGNVQQALALKSKIDSYFSGQLRLASAMFPERFAQRIVKVGHPYPRLIPLTSGPLPAELKQEFRARAVRIFGSGKIDTVKIGRLSVGHIGKAVMYPHAKSRKGWIVLHQPSKTDATGYFAILGTRTTAYDTVRLRSLKVHQPYEWSLDFEDGAYHFVVRDGGQTVIDKTFRTIRKLDIGFAATVRRRGNAADFIVWTDYHTGDQNTPSP